MLYCIVLHCLEECEWDFVQLIVCAVCFRCFYYFSFHFCFCFCFCSPLDKITLGKASRCCLNPQRSIKNLRDLLLHFSPYFTSRRASATSTIMTPPLVGSYSAQFMLCPLNMRNIQAKGQCREKKLPRKNNHRHYHQSRCLTRGLLRSKLCKILSTSTSSN